VSSNRAVRSFGLPYFSMFSIGDRPASALPQQGVSQVSVEFALHALPPQRVSPDEINPIFSLGDYFKSPPASSVVSIGVSPSGRVIATTRYGDVIQSSAGRVSPSSGFVRVSATFDTPAQSVTLKVGVDGLLSGSLALTNPLLPTRYARAIAFNDTAGSGRCQASIRRAELVFSDVSLLDAPSITWDFSEGYGASAAPVFGANPTALNGGFWVKNGEVASNWTMNAGYWDPVLYPKLWGEIPQSDAGEAYDWEVNTAYVKRSMPVTQYRKAVSRS